MHERYRTQLRAAIERIRADGFYKTERVIDSPQSARSADPGSMFSAMELAIELAGRGAAH